MMKTYSPQLTNYSIFAASFLLLHGKLPAQAVYHDIDPDIVLDEHFDSAEVDMDMNGINDFGFYNGYTFVTLFTTYGNPGIYLQRNVQWAYPENDTTNGIAGSYQYSGPSNTWIRYYPFALEINETINSELTFQHWDAQRMAFYSLIFSVFPTYGGNWYPELTDHYLGVYFKGEDGNNHYGWIRCDVLSNGEITVIKDYAYELKPETAILAGDTIGDTTTIGIANNHPSIDATIYSFNKTIYIALSEVLENAQVEILNGSGAIVFQLFFNSQTLEIPMKVAAGNYFVTIKSEDKMVTKLINIE